jgi:hypothetical protein
MEHYSPVIERIQTVRNFQPSAIRSSVVMALIQYASLGGFMLLTVISISLFVEAESLESLSRKNHKLNHFLELHQDIGAVLDARYSVYHAYFILVIALLFLLIWKLTTMVRRRNAYILAINMAMDEEKEQ